MNSGLLQLKASENFFAHSYCAIRGDMAEPPTQEDYKSGNICCPIETVTKGEMGLFATSKTVFKI